MARVLNHFVEPVRECSYIPGREAQLEIRVQLEVTPRELDEMLERGWRRFGPVYFRPACATCSECVTLRVDASAFTPSKSQRRALKNASRLTRTIGRPVVDDERLALYAKWHAAREDARGWEPSDVDAQRYRLDFAFPHPSIREASFRDPARDNQLVGLGIFDATPRALSAVYFFWDPEIAPPSLGVANVVSLLLDAKAKGIPHVYLGYRVLECASLVYKTKYRPHELLVGRPDADEAPTWEVETGPPDAGG